MPNTLTDSQRRTAHSKLKENPYKNAAQAMSKTVADDGILNRLKTLKDAKAKAGEAPPEPPGPQEHKTHQIGLEGVLNRDVEDDGDGADVTEQALDTEPNDHHAKSVKSSMNEVLSSGSAGEKAPNKEVGDNGDSDTETALSHVDRIARHFNSPRNSKRSVHAGANSKSDFGSLHARSLNKARKG